MGFTYVRLFLSRRKAGIRWLHESHPTVSRIAQISLDENRQIASQFSAAITP